MQTIVLASHNPGKITELQALLAPYDFTIVAHDGPEIEETGLSFVENAILKARHAASQTGLAAIADDSGLEVYALQGAPGIYSARYAGVQGDAVANYQKLLTDMQGIQERRARFQCVLVFMRHEKDPSPIIAQASWEGEILLSPRGGKGFGYDPVFWVPEYACSAAELDPDVKNKIGHRGQALRKLLQQLKVN